MAPDILLIGTGITSALCATYLQKSAPSLNITLWDKGRGIGGRMSRCISPNDDTCFADLGAQYITTNKNKMENYGSIYEPLIKDGIIEPLHASVIGMKEFDANTVHLVAPLGMNAIVKYFLRTLPKDNIRCNSKAVAIEKKDKKFLVTSEDGCSFMSDIVVSTIPVPQFLQLSGSVKDSIPNESDLFNVRYSSRFVLVLYYDRDVQFPDTNWACKYLDHHVFRFVSIDNLKRNRSTEPTAVIFHTSVQFGLKNLDMSLLDMKIVLLEFFRELFPDWPEPSASRCHKWRFSQVTKPFEGKPGCLILNRNPTLILGGDAFAESNFDGCIYSALKVVEAVRQSLKTTDGC